MKFDFQIFDIDQKTSLKQNKKINLYANVNWTMQQLQILFGPWLGNTSRV